VYGRSMLAASNSGLPLTEATILLAIIKLVVASLSSVIVSSYHRFVRTKKRDVHEWRNKIKDPFLIIYPIGSFQVEYLTCDNDRLVDYR